MYHNPSCSKSRGALEILADQGIDHDVVEYLTALPAGQPRAHRRQCRGSAAGSSCDRRFEELGLSASDYGATGIELLLSI